jgi:hypothetical protein
MSTFTDAEIDFAIDTMMTAITKPNSENETPVVWIDSSDRSHLVVCEICHTTIGPFESRRSAQKSATTHRASHKDDLPEQRPNGRPRNSAPSCVQGGCTKPVRARGQCEAHYRQALRRERS